MSVPHSTTRPVREAAARLGLSVARTRRLIGTGALASVKAGARRYVTDEGIEAFLRARQERELVLRNATPQEWDWEGNLVETLSASLQSQGWSEVSRADAVIRKHGIDLVMTRDERTRVIEVKGWPTSTHRSGPKAGQPKRWRSTTGRNYMADLVFSGMLLRSSRPDDEVAIAVPEETFLTLLERVRSQLEALGIGAYVIDQNGDVRAFLAVEEVDRGRLERDRRTDKAMIRRLVSMSDRDREAHFIDSNRAALEMLIDARRAR
ncbi:hypothetical protein BH23CHL8_BH23CHL8_10730 [soil metagenome]